MSWFSSIFRKKQPYRFTDEEREISADIRRQKAEISKMKLERENLIHKMEMERKMLELKAEITELKGIDGDDEQPQDDFRSLIQMLAMMGGNQQQPQQFQQQQPQKISLTDEQLKKIWEDLPAAAKSFSKRSSDETIKSLILSNMPNIDDDSMQRAISLVRAN